MNEDDDVVSLIFYTIHEGILRAVSSLKVESCIANLAFSKFARFKTAETDTPGLSPVFDYYTADKTKRVVVDFRVIYMVEISIVTEKSDEVRAKGDDKLKKKKEEKNGGR